MPKSVSPASPGPSAEDHQQTEETPEEQQTAEGSTPNAASTSISPKNDDSGDSDDSQDDQDDENAEEEEDDGGETAKASSSTPQPVATAPVSQWQAVWSPQYNAYYFFNPTTQETTWTNPLQPESEASTSSNPESSNGEGSSRVVGRVQTIEEAAEAAIAAAEASAQASSSSGPQMSAAASHYAALQAAALAQGIDPALAHLDPTLLQSNVPGSTGGPGDLPTFQAKFNARTGQFAPMSSRTPGHLSEYERAKRMSEFYFDVGKWEEDLAKRGGRNMAEEGDQDGGQDANGKKRKRPSKKDLERYKEQKKAKKVAKTAWLRT